MIFPYKKKKITLQDIKIKSESKVASFEDFKDNIKGDVARRWKINATEIQGSQKGYCKKRRRDLSFKRS